MLVVRSVLTVFVNMLVCPGLSILIEKKNRSIIKVQWIHCKPLDSNKCQDYTASRIVKICPLVAKILHIVWWGILF